MVTNEGPIALTIHPAPAPWDTSLATVGRALTARLAREGRLAADGVASGLVIDLARLGATTTPWSPAGSATVLPLRLDRSRILCGPCFEPATGRGPCPACLERRWRLARHPEEQRALAHTDRAVAVSPEPLTPFAIDALWSLVSRLVKPAALPPRDAGVGTFYALQLDTLQVTTHGLVADSLCPVCAAPPLDSPETAVVALQPRPKRTPTSYRLTSPMDYSLPTAGYLNPVCGTFGSQPLPDYTSSVTAPVSGSFVAENRYKPFEAWWGGHAATYRRSERIGLLEALERYSGLRPRARRVAVYDSYANLGPQALNPLECGVYEPAYYANPRNAMAPFTPERKLYWVWGYSFRRQQPILVPEDLVYYLEYRQDSTHFVRECSNGCATGSTFEEATLFGLLELIERDAFLMMWYARLAPPRIDPASCRTPSTLHMLNRIERLGYEVALFDTRMDIPVPSVTAVARRRDRGMGSLVLAAGASLDPEEAIRSAVCEIGSYLPEFARRTEQRQEELRGMARDYSSVTRIDHHAALYGLPEMLPEAEFMYAGPVLEPLAVRYADWLARQPRSLDLSDDLRAVIAMLLERGLDVIAVDQSAPEAERAGIKVVCTIVPGLLPMEFGYACRRYMQLPRLRTVPREAGYTAHDFDPAQANTVPHPFP